MKEDNTRNKNKAKTISNMNIIKNKNKSYNNKEYDSDKTDIFNEENKNLYNYKEIINKDDNDNEEEINNNHDNKSRNKNKKGNNKRNSIEKKEKKEETKAAEMWTELDLDKYRNPKNIRIKINNPFYPLYQLFNKDKQQQIKSLNKIYKNKNKANSIYNNYNNIKRDSSNHDIIRINKKNLAPIKLKRRTKTNSTSSLYTTKSDYIGGISDHNYFNNREIIKAMGNRNGRNCEACFSTKNLEKHNLKNRLSMKPFESCFRNNFINEEKNKIRRKKSNEAKNDNYSYNKNRKINNIRGSKSKNKSFVSNTSLSSKYANVINIEFPVLSSYFHGQKEK